MKSKLLTKKVNKHKLLNNNLSFSEKVKFEKLLYEIELLFYFQENGLNKNLISEGFVDRIKNKINNTVKNVFNKPDKAKIPYTSKLVERLRGMLTPEGLKRVIQIAKNYSGSTKNFSEINNYVNTELRKILSQGNNLEEGIFTTFFKPYPEDPENPKSGEYDPSLPPVKNMKEGYKILYYLLFGIIALGGVFNQDFDDEENTFEMDDEVSFDADQDTNLGFIYDTGQYEFPNPDKVIADVSDAIIATLDGKSIDSSSKITIKGNISNTGPNSDNPDGPKDSGLGQLRAQAGMELVPGIAKTLLQKAPNLFPNMSLEDISNMFVNGGSNADNLGPQVEKGSEEALNDQYTLFDFEDIQTKEAPNQDNSSPSLEKFITHLKNPRELFNKSKYYVILFGILPAITDNKQPSNTTLKLIAGDDNNFYLTDKKINNRREVLFNSEQTKETKEALYILEWIQAVKKNPQSIVKFLNKLDSNIAIPWQKRKLSKPGEKGKTAFHGDLGRTDNYNGNFGDNPQALAEYRLLNILTERTGVGSTPNAWSGLPDFNLNKAKENIGYLVPLIVYLWDLEDNGSIEYVANKKSPYRNSFNKFIKLFPNSNIKKLVNKDLKYVDGKEKTKSNKQKSQDLQEIIGKKGKYRLLNLF